MTFLPPNTNASLVGPSFIATPPDGLNMPIWAKSAGGSRSSATVTDLDSGNAIAIDSVGNSYITGKLQGSNIAFGSTTVSTQDLSPDAFVTKLDASGNFLWTKTFGGLNPSTPAVSVDVGQGITVDAQGNVYVIGSFQGSLQLSSATTLTSTGVSDVFVLKLNGTDGSVNWGKNFGSAGIEQGFAIALDSSSNAYITGTFGDTKFATPGQVVSSDMIFGTTTLIRSGPTDAFVAKLDGTNGTVSWAKKYGGSGSDVGYGIAATATGVYVTGSTENAGNINAFAVKLDSSNGNIAWDKSFGGAGEDAAQAIRVDSNGNAYLTGYLKSSTANFGTIELQSNTINMFAAKLNDLDGSVAWAKSLGGPLSAIPGGISPEHYANGIGLDGRGNVYLAGLFTGSLLGDIFVLKLNGNSGETVWGRSFGGSGFDSAYALAVDSAGNPYITGEFSSPSLTLGSQTLATAGGTDFFVTKLDGRDPIVPPSSPLDLVFYDPIKGQVSFGFVGNSFNINSAALTGDTPVLTKNADASTEPFGTAWRLVSAGVDVDKDGVKDLILALNANNAVAVVFGAARSATDRQFAYRNSAFVTANGGIAAPGTTWTLDFASNKIGANDSPGLFWRSNAGDVAIWSLSTTTTAGETSVSLANSGIIASVGNSGWKAIGDGEFNASTTSREVLWTNDPALSIASWSLNSARTIRTAKFAASGPVPTNSWGVIGITSISGTGNDNVIWQSKTASTLIVWNMVDGAYATTGAASLATPVVISLTAGDRIKSFADVDVDGVIDLIGQGSDGSIAAYALTSSFALKNTVARTQYTASNTTYRPGKGGPNNAALELVNVAQYGV
jgi:hypothetical protein